MEHNCPSTNFDILLIAQVPSRRRLDAYRRPTINGSSEPLLLICPPCKRNDLHRRKSPYRLDRLSS